MVDTKGIIFTSDDNVGSSDEADFLGFAQDDISNSSNNILLNERNVVSYQSSVKYDTKLIRNAVAFRLHHDIHESKPKRKSNIVVKEKTRFNKPAVRVAVGIPKSNSSTKPVKNWQKESAVNKGKKQIASLKQKLCDQMNSKSINANPSNNQAAKRSSQISQTQPSYDSTREQGESKVNEHAASTNIPKTSANIRINQLDGLQDSDEGDIELTADNASHMLEVCNTTTQKEHSTIAFTEDDITSMDLSNDDLANLMSSRSLSYVGSFETQKKMNKNLMQMDIGADIMSTSGCVSSVNVESNTSSTVQVTNISDNNHNTLAKIQPRAQRKAALKQKSNMKKVIEMFNNKCPEKIDLRNKNDDITKKPFTSSNAIIKKKKMKLINKKVRHQFESNAYADKENSKYIYDECSQGSDDETGCSYSSDGDADANSCQSYRQQFETDNIGNGTLSSDVDSSGDLDDEQTICASEDGSRLQFEITNSEGLCVVSDSCQDAWTKVTDRLSEARRQNGMSCVSYNCIDGLSMFGLNHSSLIRMIEQLEGATYCRNYRPKYFKHTFKEQKRTYTGSARCDEYYSDRRILPEMFSFLMSRYRHRPKIIPANTDNNIEDYKMKSQMRQTTLNLPMAMRFRHLKDNSKQACGVYKSDIHGRGLFCKRDIDQGEMIIEYAGEVIRSCIADKREHYYDEKGIDCYMFRIDEHHVIDATYMGNAARFINHSCDPSCTSKVIILDDMKHIIIFAIKPIKCGEEMTYDYKFPIENDKIRCRCKSKKCRKYLN